MSIDAHSYITNVKRTYAERLLFVNVVLGGLVYSVVIGALSSKFPTTIAWIASPLVFCCVYAIKGFYANVIEEINEKYPDKARHTFNYITADTGMIRFAVSWMPFICGLILYIGLLAAAFFDDVPLISSLVAKCAM